MPMNHPVPFAEWRKAPNKTSKLCLPSGHCERVVSLKKLGGKDEAAKLLDDAPKEVREAALDGLTASDEFMGRFVISNERRDSYGDTIAVKGWQLDDFKRNPVVLFAHDSDSLPIGKDIGVHQREGVALHGITKFAPAELNPLAPTVARMLQEGYLNATSVGFVPLAFDFDETDAGSGMFPPVNFKEQRLAEYSVVPVPANPDALADGRTLAALGIDLRPVQQWAEKLLDEGGSLVIPRSAVEGLARSGRGRMAFKGGVVLLSGADPVLKAVPVAEAEEPTTEPEAVADGDAACRCPSCGWEGRNVDFLLPGAVEATTAAVAPVQPPAAVATAATSVRAASNAELMAELTRRGLAGAPRKAPGTVPKPTAATGAVDNEGVQRHDDPRLLEERALRVARTAVRDELRERTGRLD